ncbi:MAG: hypothetical protein ACYDAD_00920 [Acidimicrobiales bacterium]
MATAESHQPIDLRRTWQVAAGSILLTAGLILILLGWAGAARSPLVEEQIPYVVSGGLLGLALTVTGSFFFWGHWLYRRYERAEYHHREIVALLESLVAGRHPGEVVESGPSARVSEVATPGAAAFSGGDFLVRTERGTVLHRAGCAVLEGKPSTHRVPRREVARTGLDLCRLCNGEF